MASRPVKLKLVPRSTVKAKSMTRIAGQVAAGEGVLVERANGITTVSVDADNLPAVVGLVIGVDVQAFDSDLSALAANATNGMWARTAAGTGSARTLTGTANRITVTNGDGVSGNPTFDLSTSYVGQATITTLGTIATGTWQATKVGLAYGGTNADLSATGGTSQVLKQASAGAAVTVGQLATTDLTGLGTGVATFLATPSSANLRSALTDEVGTGAAYFVGGALGTPASATLTNATGLPLTTGVTGVLPVANFTTGTPTGSKFVRDDGVLTVPAGGGDFVGPASSTDNAAVRFDSTTGKLGQGSALIIDDTTGRVSRSGNGGIQQQGTNTNDSAAAGDVGEYIESVVLTGAAVSPATGVLFNITSITLSPGDWDVSALVIYKGGATTQVSFAFASISATSITIDATPGRQASATLSGSASTPFTGGNEFSMAIPPYRLSTAGSPQIFLVTQESYSVSTMSAYGIIRARRVR